MSGISPKNLTQTRVSTNARLGVSTPQRVRSPLASGHYRRSTDELDGYVEGATRDQPVTNIETMAKPMRQDSSDEDGEPFHDAHDGVRGSSTSSSGTITANQGDRPILGSPTEHPPLLGLRSD